MKQHNAENWLYFKPYIQHKSETNKARDFKFGMKLWH